MCPSEGCESLRQHGPALVQGTNRHEGREMGSVQRQNGHEGSKSLESEDSMQQHDFYAWVVMLKRYETTSASEIM